MGWEMCVRDRSGVIFFFFFFFQAENGIRDVERSRGLGDLYKRQSKILVRIIKGA